MTDPSPDRGRFVSMPASVPVSSLRPKRSIFTLRPFSHTEAPPAESGAQPQPGSRSRRARWLVVAMLVVGAVPAAWWAGHAKKKRDARVPVVLVNGTPQTKQTAQGHAERWGSGEVTVAIDASIESIGPGARAAVQNAFGTWLASGAKLPALRFDTTSGRAPKLERDGVDAVLVAPIDLPGHKKDLAMTISFADPSTGRIVESDIVINSKKPFALLDLPPAAPGKSDDDQQEEQSSEAPGCKGWYDLQDVVTHEAGHFFGLDEDMEDGASTMFYKTAKCELRKRDLETPDRTVMTALYEGPPPGGGENAADTGAGCGGASVARSKPIAGSTWALVGLAGIFLAARRRR